MTDDRDYYRDHRDARRSGASSRGMVWVGVAIVGLLVLISVFYLFAAPAPPNGTAAPNLTPPEAGEAEPATPPETSAPLQ